MTPVLEKPYIRVSINLENIIFWHFTNGGHTRKSIMAEPMFLRIKRSSQKQLRQVSLNHPTSGFELTTLVVIGTDCIGSCKSNHHTIKTMTVPNSNVNY